MAADHHPVLLDEALAGLAIRPDGLYVDATFGRGGHSGAVLDRLSGSGRLVALDMDPQAIAVAEQLFASDKRFTALRGSFGDIDELLETIGVTGDINGILFDLGVSSPQLDSAERGFSFARPGPLDMRMNPDSGVPASEWLDTASETEIADVIRKYGEERYARRIARRIVTERKNRPVADTGALAQLIKEVVPAREPGKHPATRTFQAIRIFINDELTQLELALDRIPRLLAIEGRLCVISFHSLEDRIVKRFMRNRSRADARYAGLPDMPDWARPSLRTIGRAVRPSVDEIAQNPRSRSAVLRVAERRAQT